jgi:hypothetical protein
MKHATGSGGIPMDFSVNNGTSDINSIPLHINIDWSLLFHGLCMGGTFVLLLPLGIIYLRIFERIRLHIFNQTIGLVFITIGFALGIKVSSLYLKARDCNSPHQILGFVVLGLVYLQFIIGVGQHYYSTICHKRTGFSYIHIVLGQVVIFLGIFNGGLGLRWSDARPAHFAFYLFCVFGMAGLYFILSCVQTRRKAKLQAWDNPRARNYANGDEHMAPSGQGAWGGVNGREQHPGESWEMQRQRREYEPRNITQ